MNVSEDGTVTGSIDQAKLAEVKPKTDEAKAQIEALRAEAQAGQDQANAAAVRLAEQAVAQNPNLAEAPQDNRDVQGKPVADQTVQPDQPEDIKPLQAEAEAAGVTVDKRWGADRLRQEIDTAKAAKSQSSQKQR